MSSPRDSWDTERLIVAAQADGLIDHAGVARNREALGQFHRANPMGEMRITR